MSLPATAKNPKMAYEKLRLPSTGEKITVDPSYSLQVPDRTIIPYIEGDGIGIDITPVMKKVVDAAVGRAYGDQKQIQWMEIYAGEKATHVYGEDVWLPQDTLNAVREFVVSIKGPLTTPVGGGIRSLNVTLRQELDLYVCLRPVRYFQGTPSPLREPEHTDMVIFRENSEDIYAGVEWQASSPEAHKVIDFLQREMGVTKIRFPKTSGIGVKPVLGRDVAAGAQGHPVRDRQRPGFRDPGAQGKYHEVHGGGLQILGLRAGQSGVRCFGDRCRSLVPPDQS